MQTSVMNIDEGLYERPKQFKIALKRRGTDNVLGRSPAVRPVH